MNEVSGFSAANDLPDAGTQAHGARRLKVVFVGHVDHGKSTLIGRILHDTNSLPDGRLEQVRRAAEAEGMPFEYAFLLDALLEEQEQNITIDTTQIQFKTMRREYVIVDAPGHREFLKNMITGAASADAAVLLIAANEGVQEQSRRHGYLLSLLGIQQVLVAVNKMDLAGYDQATFERLKSEYTEFLSGIGLTAQQFVPIVARDGDNVARRADDTLPWYDGPTILQALDSFTAPPSVEGQPLRFPIQDVYRFDERRILAGRIETGTLRVGDTLQFWPAGKSSTVATIEHWSSDASAPTRNHAIAGESVGITLADQIFAERGNVAAHAVVESSAQATAPLVAQTLRANLFWMNDTPLQVGDRARLRLATQETECTVTAVARILDVGTLDTATDRVIIRRNDVAEVTLRTATPLVWDNHAQLPILGRFVLMGDRQEPGNSIRGGGILIGGTYTRADRNQRNLVENRGTITPKERALQNGHGGAVVWLTGLSGSGKSTVANALERTLFNQGRQVVVLDGDNLRNGLNSDLGFAPQDRQENIRRIAHVACLMAQAGMIVVTAFISPYQADRDFARQVASEGDIPFFEVFVDTPLDVCEARDVKGLYAKARAGEIREFTGISAPYEPPAHPEVVVRTETLSVGESVAQILGTLLPAVLPNEPEFSI